MGSIQKEPEGLGGWLILICLGLFFTIISIASLLSTTYIPFFFDGTWEILTTPGSEVYHELFGPILIYEMVGNTLIMLLAGTLIYLFFTKSPFFPKLAIAYFAGNLLFVGLDLVLVGLIPAVAASGGMESIQALIRSMVGAAIWIPYMLFSKRVKNTFTRPGLNRYQGQPQMPQSAMTP